MYTHVPAYVPPKWKGSSRELALYLIRAKYWDNAYKGLSKYFIPNYYPELGDVSYFSKLLLSSAFSLFYVL